MSELDQSQPQKPSRDTYAYLKSRISIIYLRWTKWSILEIELDAVVRHVFPVNGELEKCIACFAKSESEEHADLRLATCVETPEIPRSPSIALG
jgi:hypothetical protein